MPRSKRFFLVLSCILPFSLFASCSAPLSISPTAIPTPSLTPAPTNTSTPAPTPTPDLPPRTQYIFDITMDYVRKAADVQETIAYGNRTGETLNDVVLAIEPGLWFGGFSLKSAAANGQGLTTYTLDGQRLELTLPQPLAPNKLLTLAFNYTLILPQMPVYKDQNDIRPQIYGYTARQVNMVDWYPFIVPYEPGTGWVLHNPWFYGEHLVYDTADFDVMLRFTNPAVVPIIATSGVELPSNDGKRFRLEDGRTFAFSMSSQFIVKSQKVGDVTISSYSFPFFEAAGQAVLNTTVEAVQIYTERYGPYPYKTLAAVQGDFDDGMEFSGLYFLSRDFYNLYDGTPKNYLTTIAAHETAHMWWFSSVADDQALEPWLDESFATFSERLYYEFAHPDALPWWQFTRIDFYQPKGKIDTRIYDAGGYRLYTDAVYLRGALFLQAVRERIGDDAFYAFLKDYYAQSADHRVTADDFFRVLRAHTDADLSDIIQNYFQNPH
jgi:hypothetical protein